MSNTVKEKSKHTEPLLNKKARFNFELGDEFEAGIVLTGTEVKALREKKGNLTDSFAKVRNGEIFLENFQISQYKNKGYVAHNELRAKKLLLHKKEIIRMERAVKEKGVVLIAVKCFFKDNRRFKVIVAMGKPKKLHDKREDMLKKEAKLDIEREMKNRLKS